MNSDITRIAEALETIAETVATELSLKLPPADTSPAMLTPSVDGDVEAAAEAAIRAVESWSAHVHEPHRPAVLRDIAKALRPYIKPQPSVDAEVVEALLDCWNALFAIECDPKLSGEAAMIDHASAAACRHLSLVNRLKSAAPSPAEQDKPAEQSGVDLIAAERRRQVEAEGWTPEHDDGHTEGEMALAAACYALDHTHEGGGVGQRWPWTLTWWKPSPDPIRNLVKAGALIAAEIDRLKRAESKAKPAEPAPIIVDDNDGSPRAYEAHQSPAPAESYTPPGDAPSDSEVRDTLIPFVNLKRMAQVRGIWDEAWPDDRDFLPGICVGDLHRAEDLLARLDAASKTTGSPAQAG